MEIKRPFYELLINKEENIPIKSEGFGALGKPHLFKPRA